jgi:hypothetical protein
MVHIVDDSTKICILTAIVKTHRRPLHGRLGEFCWSHVMEDAILLQYTCPPLMNPKEFLRASQSALGDSRGGCFERVICERDGVQLFLNKRMPPWTALTSPAALHRGRSGQLTIFESAFELLKSQHGHFAILGSL